MAVEPELAGGHPTRAPARLKVGRWRGGGLWFEVVNAAPADTDAAEVRASIRRDPRYGSGA